ncbi:MAG: Ig-like domain-containing protein [Lachnospiraceae bacterium]|nr:Ig-like domain-containing protein [Lachnospiraceae bacterium]
MIFRGKRNPEGKRYFGGRLYFVLLIFAVFVFNLYSGALGSINNVVYVYADGDSDDVKDHDNDSDDVGNGDESDRESESVSTEEAEQDSTTGNTEEPDEDSEQGNNDENDQDDESGNTEENDQVNEPENNEETDRDNESDNNGENGNTEEPDQTDETGNTGEPDQTDESGNTDKTDQTDESDNPDETDEEPVPKTKRPKPVLRKTSVTLYAGWNSYEIFIDKLDEEASVTYKSSKTAVATVDEEGVVTPLKKGTTRITIVVTDTDGRKTKLKLTVKVLKPYTEVTDSTDALTSNGEYLFKLKRYGHANEVKWTLTGSQFATIEAVSDTDCLIKGIAPGYVVMTAECGEFTESFDIRVYEGSGEAYKITPTKDPYKGYFMSRSEYNEYTKDYYVARSYLERLATAGGGILVFGAGTYHITNTLCVPSNTTILLEDGATIVKSDQTGTSWLVATQSLFQTVAYNHTQTKFKKYNGEHDISIIGEGSATIDLNFVKSIAVTAAHCQNLTIKGIAFRNLNSLHFIELDASKNVEISGNLFADCIASPTQRKEAINLDTPDELTHGFNQGWTSFDKTPNAYVTICDNVFENLETAIGTHKYSERKYHKYVVIQRNTFIDVTNYVVRMMNWKNCEVSDNYFINVDKPESSVDGGSGQSDDFENDDNNEMTDNNNDSTDNNNVTDDKNNTVTAKAVNAIILNGVVNPTITGNYFNNYTTVISCAHWKNSGDAKVYAETYNKLSKANLRSMKKNEVVSCVNNYFEVYTVYGDKTEKYLEKYKFSK